MTARNDNQIELKQYQEVRAEWQKSQQRHLLLGNRFNQLLKVYTDYENIFDHMKKIYWRYEDIQDVFENECNRNIEKLPEALKKDAAGNFLPDYIQEKVYSDFRKALFTIIASRVAYIYKAKNQVIHALLDGFVNYFTLNYDPFLYQLLMKFEVSDNQPTFQSLLDEAEDPRIYEKISEAYNKRIVSVSVSDDEQSHEITGGPKNPFTVDMNRYLRPNWSDKEIGLALKNFYKFLGGEKNRTDRVNELLLWFNDGWATGPKSPDKPYNPQGQNLFYLHGAFHIYQDSKGIYKSIRQGTKSLYAMIEENLSSDENEIVWVFRGEDKLREIEKNDYLRTGYQKLSKLNGALVIIGCALAENDTHIFKQINDSQVDSIYIASSHTRDKRSNKGWSQLHYARASKYFPNVKTITLFDWETILPPDKKRQSQIGI